MVTGFSILLLLKTAIRGNYDIRTEFYTSAANVARKIQKLLNDQSAALIGIKLCFTHAVWRIFIESALGNA